MTDPHCADGRDHQRVVIVGEFTRSEFAPVLERLVALVGPDTLLAAGSLGSLLAENRSSGTARHVDLLIVLQTWPEQYPRGQILALLDQYPLTRLVVCYGPWCDSDGRTRDLWPPATRVPLAHAGNRIEQELAVLQGAAEPLPLTASRDETYWFDYVCHSRRPLPTLAVEVRTPDPAIRDLLGEMLRAGHGSVFETPQATPDLLIWDVDPWSDALAGQIAGVHRQHPELPILALAGFARAHEVTRMRHCGVLAVVAKTAPAEEILNVITSLSCKPSKPRPTKLTPAEASARS